MINFLEINGVAVAKIFFKNDYHELILDLESLEKIKSYTSLGLVKRDNKIYARVVNYTGKISGKYKYEYLYVHRILLGLKKGDGILVDHKDGNGLNNKLSNLRICNDQENSRNQKISKANTSGYKGVYFNGRNFTANIKLADKTKSLGRFDKKEDAARAYNKAALENFGEFANINIIEENK